jgi:hypothetical protein
MESIRPNQLASKASLALLLRRNRKLLDLQRQIEDYQGDIVDAVSNSLQCLHQTSSRVVSYVLTFYLHFCILEYRI